MPKLRKGKSFKKKIPEEEKGIFAIKLAEKLAIREKYRAVAIPWVSEISIKVTKICGTTSLLFLDRVKTAHEEAVQTNDCACFTEGNGIHIIEECFFSTRMATWMHDFVDQLQDRFTLPNNCQFGAQRDHESKNARW